MEMQKSLQNTFVPVSRKKPPQTKPICFCSWSHTHHRRPGYFLRASSMTMVVHSVSAPLGPSPPGTCECLCLLEIQPTPAPRQAPPVTSPLQLSRGTCVLNGVAAQEPLQGDSSPWLGWNWAHVTPVTFLWQGQQGGSSSFPRSEEQRPEPRRLRRFCRAATSLLLDSRGDAVGIASPLPLRSPQRGNPAEDAQGQR